MFISKIKEKFKLMRRKRYHVEKFQLNMKNNYQEPPAGKFRQVRDVGCQCDPPPSAFQIHSNQHNHSKTETSPLIKTLFEYSQYTSVHGIKYLAQSKCHWMEKFFWIFSIIISLIICAVFISFIYQQWQKTPVRLNISEKTTAVTEIPFPAVTICPETKAKKDLFDFTQTFRDIQSGKVLEKNYEKFQIIQFLCNEVFRGIPSKNITSQTNRNSTEIDVAGFLNEVAPSLDDIFHTCRWQNVAVDCSKYFSKVMTDQGVCYTFNLLDRPELYNDGIIGALEYSNNRRNSTWSIEDGYSSRKNSYTNSYPEHVLGSGIHNGLSLILKLNTSNYDYLCNDGIQGFRLHLNSPTDIPRLSTSFINISPGHFAVIGLAPQKTTITGKLISYSSDQRRCYYSNERKLKYFKQYTQQNCHDECLTDFTLKTCGCVPFWMPRTLTQGGNGTRICYSNEDLNCTLQAELRLSAVESKGYLNVEDQNNASNWKPCQCFPACYTIEYDHQISTVNFDWIKMHKEFEEDVSKYKNIELARLKIFFKDQQFITMKHNEVYSFSDLVAAIGGLLGLFLGASMLSVLEIIYFFFVHIFMNFIRNKEPTPTAN